MTAVITHGVKYTGFRDVVDIAKDVRRDLKAAQKTGDLPAQVRFSVRAGRASMMQEIVISIGGTAPEEMWDAPASGDERCPSAEQKVLVQRVTEIADAYNQHRVYPGVADDRPMYWLSVSLER